MNLTLTVAGKTIATYGKGVIEFDLTLTEVNDN
jgi:hypothetical protein